MAAHPPGPRAIAPAVALVVPARAAHRECLRAITQDMSVMKWIAGGNTWTDARLDRFFEYCAEEEAEGPKGSRDTYYYVVEADGVCAGVVGVHPAAYNRGASGQAMLTVYLAASAAGRGVGTRAIALVLARYWAAFPARRVEADVRADNSAMQRAAAKAGFARADDAFGRPVRRRIGRKFYHQYAISPPPAGPPTKVPPLEAPGARGPG